jgi:eukaryotic-like serine/threonine-protein kinase
VRSLRASVFVLIGLIATGCGAGRLAEPGTSPTASGGTVPSGFVLYSSASPAFSIAHPAAWKARTDASTALVALVAPLDGSQDQFAENVNVLRQDVAAGTTLAQYTEASLRQAGSMIQGFVMRSAYPATLSGLPAEAVEYSGSVETKAYHWFAEWTVTGTAAYVVTYSAQPHSYERFLQDARATIESFHLG